MAIDTDDLTDNTYNAILTEAERFHHDLTLQFGLLGYECKSEAEFIKLSDELVRKMLTYNEAELEDIFSENLPTKKNLHITLNKILNNISRLPK